MAALSGNWKDAVIASLVYTLLAGVVGAIPVIGPVANLFIVLPMAWGLNIALLNLYRNGEKVTIESILVAFKGGQNEYIRITLTLLLMMVYVMLWSLLLWVPGIIKMISYSMTYFIIKDEPELKNNAAIEKSMAMMEGNKMRLFMLGLFLMLVGILACITVVGIFWFIPYAVTTLAAFYEDLKKNYEPKLLEQTQEN